MSISPLIGGDANLYGYVLQDPINFIDSEGESRSSITDRTYGGPGTTVGPISGYTGHGLSRAIGGGSGAVAGRSVSPRSILDTVRNPISTQPNPGGGTQYYGTTSTVILNPQGRIITTWLRGSEGLRCQPK